MGVCLATSTTGGLRSGRERKDHTPFEGAGETRGSSRAIGTRKGLSLGVCKDSSFVTRPEPFAALRTRQGEAGGPGAQDHEEPASCELGAHSGTLHYSRELFEDPVSWIQAVQQGWL